MVRIIPQQREQAVIGCSLSPLRSYWRRFQKLNCPVLFD
jgi:hypothetical protein